MENSPLMSDSQERVMSEGMSSLSLTVAAKDTASPRETTSPLLGDVRVRVGGVPMATKAVSVHNPPTSSSTRKVMV